jgi:hypothetical protein
VNVKAGDFADLGGWPLKSPPSRTIGAGVAKRCPHPLGHDARDRIGRTASRIGHDHRHGPRWIALRVRNTRDSREGGGNCCEMQELPAGKLMSRWVGSPAACVGCYVKPQLNLGKLRMSEIGFSGRDDQLEIRSAELGEAVISIATR